MVGTLLDGIHVYGDVESYDHEAFGRWAWFVPVEFGLAGVVAGLAAPLLERLVGPAVTPLFSVGRRAAELGFFTALYILTALLDGSGTGWLIVILAGLLAIRLILLSVPGDWAYAAVAAAAGPLGEIAVHATGAFQYAHPDIAGIPAWLPLLWAHGGLLIRRLFVPLTVGHADAP